ncbi:hypothetical protein AcW1_007963 [Taiwanofungus camphoratus]|nr:hypothetical protein AcW1_007963 [Antrodia cinnamomea]
MLLNDKKVYPYMDTVGVTAANDELAGGRSGPAAWKRDLPNWAQKVPVIENKRPRGAGCRLWTSDF